MWLRIDARTISDDFSAKYILSSGGHTAEVVAGGIAIVLRHGELWVEVRLRDAERKWIAGRIPVVPDEWFHVAVTWSRSSNLTVYKGGERANTVRSKYMRPSQETIDDAFMLIGTQYKLCSKHYSGLYHSLKDTCK